MRERMVTHRKYFSIVTMMGVLVFMFLFTQVAKETLSEYDTNAYAEEPRASGSLRWSPPEDGAAPSGSAAEDAERGRGFILLFGDRENAVGQIVRQWCLYTKRELTVLGGVSGYALDERRRPELVLVDSAAVNYGRDVPALAALAEEGVHLVFCNLPDVSVVRSNPQLQELLGIQEIRADEVETEGAHLFGNFFLGGSYMYILTDEIEKTRQDLELNMPWYVTLTGTKTYMVGMLNEMLEKEVARNEYFPPIIWRNSYGKAKVFAVNGDYMSDLTGLGILSAAVYETRDYVLYPVVNAQNLMVADYPNFSNENTRTIQDIYGRTPQVAQQDILWPALLAMARRGGWRLTGFLTPQYDYQDGVEPDAKNLRFYLQQFKEAEAEAGVSFHRGEDVSLEEKTRRDADFYRSLDNGYAYSAAYVEAEELGELEALRKTKILKGLRTVVCPWNPELDLLFYCGDEITVQCVVSDARFQPYSENVRLKSLETALGYSNVKIDMHDVLWPESEETHWEKVHERVVSNLDTWWKPFGAFDKTTLTQSDARLRTFLNLDYREHREGDRVYLRLEGVEEDAWFLLRTHGEGVAEITGAEHRQVETDAYLIHVLEPEAEIRLEKSRGILKYTLPND